MEKVFVVMAGQSSSRSKFRRRRLVANSSPLSTKLVTLLGILGGNMDWFELATETGRDILLWQFLAVAGELGYLFGFVLVF